MEDRLQEGIRLFNNRAYFECHEALEEEWMRERGPRRIFLQSLIHIAVAFYHCERGNPVGATRQLQKGLRKLAPYLPCCEGIDTARLHREALDVLHRIQAGAAVPAYPQIHRHISPPPAIDAAGS